MVLISVEETRWFFWKQYKCNHRKGGSENELPISFKTKYAMALYMNEEGPIRLTDAEIKGVENHFHGKFPVKVVYPPDRVKKSRLAHNRLPDQPNSISFDYKAVVKTPKGVQVWRYAENVITDVKGHKRYVPKKFLYDGIRHLQRNDIELIFFLLRKSEYCLGGDNYQGTPKFMFEDLVTAAEKRAEKKRIETKVNNLLYDEEYALTEDKLRAVARAYQITGVDELRLAQIKNILSDKIFATAEGPDAFFTMIEDDEQIKARQSISKAMEMGILKCDTDKRQWYWQAKGENGISNICKVPPTKTPATALYDFYLGNTGFREDLKAALMTSNPKAGKKVAETADKEE